MKDDEDVAAIVRLADSLIRPLDHEDFGGRAIGDDPLAAKELVEEITRFKNALYRLLVRWRKDVEALVES